MAPSPDTPAGTPPDAAVASRSRPRTSIVVAAVLLSLTLGGGAAASAMVWYRNTLDQAKRDLAAGRFAEARGRLDRLDRVWPGRGDVSYRRGLAAQALGDLDGAVDAWARVGPDAPEAAPAALERARLEVDRGRYAEAEPVLTAALARTGPRGRTFVASLRQELIQLLYREGRLDEAAPRIEAAWEEARRDGGPTSPAALGALQARRALDLEAYPVARVADELAEAGTRAPADPRVWLGLTRLATRTGAFDDARGWLERCLTCGAVDPPVWRAALELAVAADDPALAVQAVEQLTAADLSPARVDHLRAWLAARRDEPAAEAKALDRRLATNPADPVALERRAELAAAAGDPRRADELRRRKAEVDAARRAYAQRLDDPDAPRRAGQLARQAEALGRWFEARAWLLIERQRSPAPDPARDDRLRRLEAAWRAERPPATGPTLASLVGPIPLAPDPSKADGTTTLDFAEAGESTGLRFRFQNGQTPERQLPETMSGGVALLDHDGDGWLDVYCVQGGTFPPPDRPDPSTTSDRLFRNRRDGTFEDVSAATGIARLVHGYGHGVAVGDVDNDGRPDLLLTRWRRLQLLRNNGQGFDDVTDAWGLGGDRDWPTSAAFADLDGDGDLDLYVCHYMDWDAARPLLCLTSDPRAADAPPGTAARVPQYCAPHVLGHRVDHLYRNDGGRFVDVSKESGIDAADTDGRGLGVLAADLDGDGRIDLFVANDGTANFLFRNLGGLKFEEVALSAGVAASGEGGYQAGMGVAAGDVDGDGHLDLVVTNFFGESTTLFQALSPGLYGDLSTRSGLRAVTRYRLGFGTALADLDNDGHLDLATANGHVNDSRPVIPYAMPMQLLRGRPGGRFVDASTRAGAAWSVPRVGRGLAAGDLDNDGRIDLVAVDQAGPLVVLHNRSTRGPEAGHFVTFALEGKGSNRDAVGAVVTVEAGEKRWTLGRHGGGSYQSAGDPRLHVGLGPARRVDAVQVRWPSGRVERILDLSADRGYRLVEGEGTAVPLAGFDACPPSDSHRPSGTR